MIRPMLDILFESQTKPNLKFISQRILGFLVNLKNSTKKVNNDHKKSFKNEVVPKSGPGIVKY
jgi:hypothetical protein